MKGYTSNSTFNCTVWNLNSFAGLADTPPLPFNCTVWNLNGGYKVNPKAALTFNCTVWNLNGGDDGP